MSNVNYAFEYALEGEDEDGNPYPKKSFLSKEVAFNDDVAWPAVLYEFATMLQAIYGYEIVDHIRVKGELLSNKAHPL